MNIIQTIRRNRYKILATAVLLLLINYLYPVYNSFAHRGEVPLLPFGWEHLPDNAPQQSDVYNEQFKQAASKAMAFMEKRRQDISAPSYSAAVAIGGELVWAGATGWSNIGNNIPATTKTIYRVGSTSKAITATALARLVQEGKLDLDAPISTYMDTLPNLAWKNITTRQLASHMAGLSHYGQKGLSEQDYGGLYQVMALNKQYDSMYDALDVFDGASLRYEPGTDFHYSSLGTVLLGAVMAAADDKPYLDILSEQVFVPLNIKSVIPSPTSSDGSNNIATSYRPGSDMDRTGYVRQWRDVNLSHRLPGGGLAATPTDLVQIGLAYFDPTYLDQSIIDTFWAPQKLSNGEVNPQNYALGWRVREWEVEGVGKVWNANHGGVSRGSQALLLVVPDHKMVIAFTANTNTGSFTDFGLLFRDIIREFVSAKQITP